MVLREKYNLFAQSDLESGSPLTDIKPLISFDCTLTTLLVINPSNKPTPDGGGNLRPGSSKQSPSTGDARNVASKESSQARRSNDSRDSASKKHSNQAPSESISSSNQSRSQSSSTSDYHRRQGLSALSTSLSASIPAFSAFLPEETQPTSFSALREQWTRMLTEFAIPPTTTATTATATATATTTATASRTLLDDENYGHPSRGDGSEGGRGGYELYLSLFSNPDAICLRGISITPFLLGP